MSEKKHLPWLDLFRFLAAFEVLAVHARGFLFVEYSALADESKNVLVSAFYALTRMGYEAVIIFFVLSGYLVGGKSIERLGNGTFRNKDYIIDRMVRIMVPLIPALLLTIICNVLMSKTINYTELIGNLFSLQGILVSPFSGNAPLWSLPYEFWFYILIFFIAGMLLSKVKEWFWFIGIIGVFAIFSVLNSAYLFCWIIGAIGYLYKANKKSNYLFLGSFVSLLLCLFLIQISIASKSIKFEIINMIPSLNILYILLSTAFAIFIQQSVLRFPKGGLLIKVNNIGSFLAGFSYTLYLTHYPILGLLKTFGFNRYDHVNFGSLIIYMSCLIGCLLIAYLIYLPFENRTDYYKKFIKEKLS